VSPVDYALAWHPAITSEKWWAEDMATNGKTFDCVEMKNRIQAERLAEYELRKSEFASYVDFVNARVKDSELMKVVGRKARVQPAETEG
jgi:hypothetical protein